MKNHVKDEVFVHLQLLETIQRQIRRALLLYFVPIRESENCVVEMYLLCLDQNQPFFRHLPQVVLAIRVQHCGFSNSICPVQQHLF